jgi:Ser/Thr protein kinase RdoA (MazF antagonist)
MNTPPTPDLPDRDADGPPPSQALEVLTRYEAAVGTVARVERWSGGGLSGAVVWQCTGRDGRQWCLRRWPREHPSESRLRFIHQVLQTVQLAGRPPIAGPLASDQGSTYVSQGGHFWEVAVWLPGQPDFVSHPSEVRLVSACQALAHFHLATEPWSGQTGESRGLQSRCELLEQAEAICQAWQLTARHRPTRSIYELVGEVLHQLRPCLPRLERPLTLAAAQRWPLQPCLRDVWHENVLFDGQQVSGLIDYGAVDFEHPAADIARLLGSLVMGHPSWWQVGLSAYQKLRPLSPEAAHLVWIFDDANAALSGLNWARWLYVERREFGDEKRVAERLAAILARLSSPDGADAFDPEKST